MTVPVQELLNSFDALSEADKKEAAVEIFRRVVPVCAGDLTEATLVGVADELFAALDVEEAGNAPR
jgi:hypothetical protein